MTDRVRGEPGPVPKSVFAIAGRLSSNETSTHALAPYALVRLAALPHPDGAAGAAPFRRAVEALAGVESKLLSLAGPVSKLLHDSAGTHPDEFHRRVVLPLRRDVHNGRMPRRALLAAVDPLISRFPQLGTWLELTDERAALVDEVERWLPAALAAEREVLASLCSSEPLRRAAVLSGRDPGQGPARAGSGDRRNRKAEPAVLRHALRATSKTSPLSWYASVGWGTWSPGAPAPDWGSPVAVTCVNHVLLTRLIAALAADRTRLFDHPHRLAPDVHEHDGFLRFRRDIPAAGAVRAHVGIEESVEVAASPPLRFLVGLTGANPKGISPAELTAALATRLPDGESERAQHHVALLLTIKLLVPVSPVDPQDPAAPLGLASWLRDRSQSDLADRLTSLYRDTVAFGSLDAVDRPAALSALTSAWQELGTLADTDLTGVPPLREDVVLPQPVRLGRSHGYTSVRSLADLTPLLMLFDRQLAVRRFARDRFVVEFGHGGVARPAACAPLLRSAWADALSGGIGASRAQVADLVSGGVITDETVSAAADLLPAWMKTRPVSYSFFAQPLTSGLVVNHIYDGFGRFPCRFLDLLPPDAYATVRATLDGIFPRGFTEYRPVQGFNANPHPLLGRSDVGEDPRWADHTPDSFEVFHDPGRDELRLRRRDTGAVMDVLYLGYLTPMSLPDRTAALHADLACGWADLSPLQSTVESAGVRFSDRLRYRDIVLLRRSWEFDSLSVADPASVAALRARHGLPAQVFVGTGGSITSRADFEERLSTPKPQYADLTNALHLHCLPRLLTRYRGRIRLTEALPVPSGQVLEVIAETYRRAG